MAVGARGWTPAPWQVRREVGGFRAEEPYLRNEYGSPLLGLVEPGHEQAFAPGILVPMPTTAQGLLDALGNPAGVTTDDVVGIYDFHETSGNFKCLLGRGPDWGTISSGVVRGAGFDTLTAVAGTGALLWSDQHYIVCDDASLCDVSQKPWTLIVWLIPMPSGWGGLWRNISKLNASNTGWRCGYVENTAMLDVVISGATYQAIVSDPPGGRVTPLAVVCDGSGVGRMVAGGIVSAPLTNMGLASTSGRLTIGKSTDTTFPYGLPSGVCGLAVLAREIDTSALAQLARYTAMAGVAVTRGGTGMTVDGGGAHANAPCVVRTLNGGSGIVASPTYTMPKGTNSLFIWSRDGAASNATDPAMGLGMAMRLSGASSRLFSVVSPPAPSTSPFTMRFDSKAVTGDLVRVSVNYVGDSGGGEDVDREVSVGAAWARLSEEFSATRPNHTAAVLNLRASQTQSNTVDVRRVQYDPVGAGDAPWSFQSAVTQITTAEQAIEMDRGISPWKGAVDVRLAYLWSRDGELLRAGTAGAAGALIVDYTSGDIRARAWDASGSLAASCQGAMAADEAHRIRVVWDARNPIPGTGGAHLLILEEAEDGSWTEIARDEDAWTPHTSAVSPIYVASGANAASCIIGHVMVYDEALPPVGGTT